MGQGGNPLHMDTGPNKRVDIISIQGDFVEEFKSIGDMLMIMIGIMILTF